MGDSFSPTASTATADVPIVVLAALRAVAEGLPDCVLLDVMMPAMDGFSVCRALKSKRRTARIPIAMLTALTAVTDKILGLNVGADDFLKEPIDPWELVSRVRSLCRIGRLRRRIEEAEVLLAAAAALVEGKGDAPVRPRSTGGDDGGAPRENAPCSGCRAGVGRPRGASPRPGRRVSSQRPSRGGSCGRRGRAGAIEGASRPRSPSPRQDPRLGRRAGDRGFSP